ncbi:MAG: hypothetical protein QM630_10060 [Microbacterium sp.]
MATPYQHPYATFSGALGDTATGGWYPANVEVSNGFVTLWVALPTGWAQYFSVPAQEVAVKSAAQRITLIVRARATRFSPNPSRSSARSATASQVPPPAFSTSQSSKRASTSAAA